MNSQTKKIIFPTLIVIIIMVIFVIGVTFAYFSVVINNDFEIIKINGAVEPTGSISVKSENDLLLNISTEKMMDMGKDVTYYATVDGIPAETTQEVAIASIVVSGENTMKCNYKLTGTISGTNNMYEAFKNMKGSSPGQLVLSVNGIDYDLYDISFPLSISGETENLTSKTINEIKASFKVVNKTNVNQNALAGTDLTISFSADEFNCEIVG